MKLTRLMAEGSGQAEAMATQVIEKDLQQAECANLLMDVYVRRPPQMTRYDALQLIVQLPGTPVKVTVALPYVPGERVEFPLEPLLQIGVGVPDSYDHDRLSRAFFSNLPDSGIGGRVPRTLVSSLDEQIDIEVTAADASSTGEQSNLDLLRLATLAPYAAFILVASADGELEPKEVTAFAQAMGRVVDPALKAMMVTCPVSPGTATGLVAGDLGLSSRALAAFGVISSDADSGTESHEALVEVVMGVARAQGELRAAELAAVMMVRRLLDGGRSAAAGPDPFPPVELSEELEALRPKAMYASTAAFLLVAAADGELEPKEVEAFGEAIGMRTNQLLMHIEESSDMAVPERVHELVANTDLILESLRAVSKIFDQHPDGDAAREAFMNTARQVARAHGDIRPEEQNSLDKVERVLRGGRGGGGVLVLLILLVAVSVIGAVGAVIGWTLFG
jgi:tellurite resistance protein